MNAVPPPGTHAIIQCIAQAGFRLHTFMSLHHYLERCRSQSRNPEPRQFILALLPWAAHRRYQPLLNDDLPPAETPPPIPLLSNNAPAKPTELIGGIFSEQPEDTRKRRGQPQFAPALPL